MATASRPAQPRPQPERFFDGFTRAMLGTMVVLLMAVFASARYMGQHRMAAAGTDDRVNAMATVVTRGEHHPFIDLPGDAQLGAFSIANFFAGIIVGYHWLRLFGKPREPK
jgi:cobalt/nickel transport protein